MTLAVRLDAALRAEHAEHRHYRLKLHIQRPR